MKCALDREVLSGIFQFVGFALSQDLFPPVELFPPRLVELCGLGAWQAFMQEPDGPCRRKRKKRAKSDSGMQTPGPYICVRVPPSSRYPDFPPILLPLCLSLPLIGFLLLA